MTVTARNRRAVLRLLARAAAILGLPALPRAQTVSDQGIGGTGVAPSVEPGDLGIGGTGVVGTIRRFGSIVVNDLRISYRDDVALTIDGQRAPVSALRLGQVVQVVADGPEGRLTTRAILVTHEVVGPIESVSDGELTVLGQTIATHELASKTAWRTGQRVAVSGLRRPDGVVVASLIDAPRPHAADRLAGPLAQAADNGLAIGGLPLRGVDPALLGQRVAVTGRRDADGLVVTGLVGQTDIAAAKPARVSLEAMVERDGDSLRVGSGFRVAPGVGDDLPEGGVFRTILGARVEAGGELVVERIHRVEQRVAGLPRGNVPTPGRHEHGFGSPSGQAGPADAGGNSIAPHREGAPGGMGGPGGGGGPGGRGGRR